MGRSMKSSSFTSSEDVGPGIEYRNGNGNSSNSQDKNTQSQSNPAPAKSQSVSSRGLRTLGYCFKILGFVLGMTLLVVQAI